MSWNMCRIGTSRHMDSRKSGFSDFRIFENLGFRSSGFSEIRVFVGFSGFSKILVFGLPDFRKCVFSEIYCQKAPSNGQLTSTWPARLWHLSNANRRIQSDGTFKWVDVMMFLPERDFSIPRVMGVLSQYPYSTAI